jgi:hypothetical protein
MSSTLKAVFGMHIHAYLSLPDALHASYCMSPVWRRLLRLDEDVVMIGRSY